RLWSNQELARIGEMFDGDVVNVSAWRDQDKAGRRYRDYFPNARSYALTNFRADMRGYQAWDGEIFLDLEQALPPDLRRRFDVVFNHTTLEHVYEFRQAFANMCALSRDVVIVVAPWLQPYHGDYGDYWRFSPIAISPLFHETGLTPARIVWNDAPGTSVYVFGVGVRDVVRWRPHFEFDCSPDRADFLQPPPHYAGREALPKPLTEQARGAARMAGLGKLRRFLRKRAPAG